MSEKKHALKNEAPILADWTEVLLAVTDKSNLERLREMADRNVKGDLSEEATQLVINAVLCAAEAIVASDFEQKMKETNDFVLDNGLVPPMPSPAELAKMLGVNLSELADLGLDDRH